MKRRPIWTTIAAVCLAGSLPFFAPQTRADEAMMKLEQNKAIVRDYLNEIVNKGNMGAFDIFFSDDVVFNETRNFREQYLRDAGDPWRLPRPSPDRTGSDCRSRQGRYPRHLSRYAQRPVQRHCATERCGMVGIAMDRIADGKVVEMWHVQNTAALLQQIGTKPPAASAK